MTTRVSWKTSLGMMLFGLPFLLTAAGFVLAGVGVLPVDKAHLNGPSWVLVPVGLAFGLPGGLYVSAGVKSLAQGGSLDTPSAPAVGIAIAAVLSCMAVAFLAVAIFGQAEGFYGGMSLFGARMGSKGGGAAVEGRAAFTVAGLIIAAIATALWILSLAALRARGIGKGERSAPGRVPRMG